MRSSLHGIVILFCLLLLLLQSCVQYKKVEVDLRLRNIDQLMASGEYQKAIHTYNSAYKRYPYDDQLVSNYVETIEMIKDKADQAYETEEFAYAGDTYTVLLNNFTDFKGFKDRLSFKRESLIVGIQNSRNYLIRKQTREYLSSGDYQQALEMYKTAYADNPQDRPLSRSYVNTIEEIKNNANRAFDKEDFPSAGMLFSFLRNNYDDFRDLEHLLSFNAGFLDERLAECGKRLFNMGLTEYRTGNIHNAITIWESQLTFDPHNEEVKKAIDTAQFQLKRLQDKE